jgi:hypothetical protein
VLAEAVSKMVAVLRALPVPERLDAMARLLVESGCDKYLYDRLLLAIAREHVHAEILRATRS